MVSVAFVCVENAGRSQMAAGFARAMAPAGVRVFSGGTMPATRVHPVVVQAMREVGIDLSHERPRRVGPADLADCDVVVTMGCSEEDVCPAHFRGDARDWTLPDPKDRTLEEVRQIRAEIQRRVEELLREIAPTNEIATRPATEEPGQKARAPRAPDRTRSAREP